jgi:hypothetical protein
MTMATKTAAKKTKSAKTTASKRTAAKKSGQAKTAAKATGGAAKTFKPGDKVAWDTSQGATQGRVVKKQTTPTKIKTHQVAASKDNPQYIVESDKSGKQAAHKPNELRKRG